MAELSVHGEMPFRHDQKLESEGRLENPPAAAHELFSAPTVSVQA
jgi:hypothetical protein